MDGAVEEPEADSDTVFVIPPPRPLFGFNWASGSNLSSNSISNSRLSSRTLIAGLVAPFVGSDEAVVAAAVTDALMYHRKSDRFCDGKAPTAVDIGCGDGRVVITAARAGVAGARPSLVK